MSGRVAGRGAEGVSRRAGPRPWGRFERTPTWWLRPESITDTDQWLRGSNGGVARDRTRFGEAVDRPFWRFCEFDAAIVSMRFSPIAAAEGSGWGEAEELGPDPALRCFHSRGPHLLPGLRRYLTNVPPTSDPAADSRHRIQCASRSILLS